MPQDVPSPIDLTSIDDATRWAMNAHKRPGRAEMLQRFVSELLLAGASNILELGSGPGFLVDLVLTSLPNVRYTALDFSAAMHSLATARLGERAGRVAWLERDFRAADWANGLGPYDAVITNQAVHELRHKSRATALHAAVRQILGGDGVYLFCDHWFGEGGMTNSELYMTKDEHSACLRNAGFATPELIATAGTLVFYRSRKTR